MEVSGARVFEIAVLLGIGGSTLTLTLASKMDVKLCSDQLVRTEQSKFRLQDSILAFLSRITVSLHTTILGRFGKFHTMVVFGEKWHRKNSGHCMRNPGRDLSETTQRNVAQEKLTVWQIACGRST